MNKVLSTRILLVAVASSMFMANGVLRSLAMSSSLNVLLNPCTNL